MPILRAVCVLGLLIGSWLSEPADAESGADLIIENAKVWTVDDELPSAEAIAVVGTRIVAVGSNDAVGVWKGRRTLVVDANSRRVLPGFNDSHVHFVSGGRELENLDLRDAHSAEEFARRIAAHARQLQEGEWIVGGNWDEQNWTPASLPSKEVIDAVTPDTPVFVSRYDGHLALANSLALRLGGIDSATTAPDGGEIVRNADGEPTGILKDAAMQLVDRVIPAVSREQRLRAIRVALAHAARLGVSSVQDMNCSYGDLAAYVELAEKGELTTRIYAAPSAVDWQDQARLGLRRGFGSDFLRLGALKGFADGSLGSSTAYFFEPFADDPQNAGLLGPQMYPRGAMLRRMVDADAAGLQLCIHGIGDQAISILLDLAQEVRETNGPRDRRFRIEHSQHVALKDFLRYHDLDVIASMQPYHAIDDGRWAETRIGPRRAETTYAFRTFLDHDVRLAFGTDWPVAPLDPLLTIYAAVTRATLDGRRPDGWVPDEKISVAEAVEAYTLGSAYAEFQEQQKGSISPGKLADIVILSEDLFEIPPRRIREVQVDMTIVGGDIVWERAASAEKVQRRE